MKKKEMQFGPQVDFTGVTPEMQIGAAAIDPKYEKAFLLREAPEGSQWSQNNTTWD